MITSQVSRGLLDDLPVRVLPEDLAVSELPVIASTHSDLDSVWGRAGQQPFHHARVTAAPVPALPVVDVGRSLEPGRQPLPHFPLPLYPPPPGLCPPRHVQY